MLYIGVEILIIATYILHIVSSAQPPCTTDKRVIFFIISAPTNINIIIQNICTAIPVSASDMPTLPEYTRKGKSAVHRKGKTIQIFCNQVGINGIGIVPPEKNSPITPNIPIEPIGDIVLKIEIYISMDIATSKINPKNKVTINSKKEIGLSGNDKLYGYGIKNPKIITGAKRNIPLANLFDSSFTYHT